MSDEKRRIIVKGQAAKHAVTQVSRVSDISTMLDNALRTLSEQLDRLSIKSRVSSFDEKDAKVLQGYISSLVNLSKEEREREKSDKLGDLAGLTDQELIELAQAKLTKIKQTDTP